MKSRTAQTGHKTLKWLALTGVLAVTTATTFLPRGTAAQTVQKSTIPVLPPSVWVLTTSQKLVHIDAADPRNVLGSKAISGLMPGDALIGIDYRVAKGVMFGLGRSGTLYTLDPDKGIAKAVNPSASKIALNPGPMGFDFNPAADRIRVVQSTGDNHRLHPDTAAIVDFNAKEDGVQTDPRLAFASTDVNAGQIPNLVAAGYTYNSKNDKLTTNFAIDGRLGALLLQGTREGVQPAVSPNLGVLTTVGAMGLGPLTDATLDISDVSNVALAIVTSATTTLPRLVKIDLDFGTATLLGTVGGGEAVAGMAIEP